MAARHCGNLAWRLGVNGQRIQTHAAIGVLHQKGPNFLDRGKKCLLPALSAGISQISLAGQFSTSARFGFMPIHNA